MNLQLETKGNNRSKIMAAKVIIFTLACNILFFFISEKYGLSRPVFNTDYAFVLLLFYFFRNNKIFKLAALVLLFIIIGIEFILLTAQIFPFIQINDLFYLSSFVFTGPLLYQKLFILSFTYILIVIITASRYFFITSGAKHNPILVLILLLCLLPLQLTQARSQLAYFYSNLSENYVSLNGSEELLIENKFESVSKTIFLGLSEKNNIPKKILFIVNEAWGEAIDPNLQKALLKPILDKKGLQEVEYGGFNFIGATVSGELRELCQKTSLVMNIEQIPEIEFNNCLPELLKSRHYKTYSIHGASANLYDRKRWYKAVGFEQSLFVDDFSNFRKCKSFFGVCDYDLFEPIAEIIANDELVFLYWLTLNTHSPYNDKIFIDDFNFNCKEFSLHEESESCNSFKQQYQYFSRLAQYLDDPRLKGVSVYVVGDHAPPIANLKRNFSVFKGSNVSWLSFKIKDE